MVIIDRDIIKVVFGEFIANNIEIIITVILVIVFIISTWRNDWLRNAIKRENKRFDASRPTKAITKSSPERTWYPTGWTYNEKTGKWDPPDYLSEETHKKWRWDEEKQIWINREEEYRMKRYQEHRKGKEPTYEEWKAARLAEQNKTPEE